jgi:hypothetical protein
LNLLLKDLNLSTRALYLISICDRNFPGGYFKEGLGKESIAIISSNNLQPKVLRWQDISEIEI